MKRKNVAVQILTIVPIAAGIFTGHFWGGLLTGASAAFFIVHGYGILLYRKAEKEADFRRKVDENE